MKKHCIAFKKTSSGRKCKKYSGTSGLSGALLICLKRKVVWKKGKKLHRCAKFKSTKCKRAQVQAVG